MQETRPKINTGCLSLSPHCTENRHTVMDIAVRAQKHLQKSFSVTQFTVHPQIQVKAQSHKVKAICEHEPEMQP